MAAKLTLINKQKKMILLKSKKVFEIFKKMLKRFSKHI